MGDGILFVVLFKKKEPTGGFPALCKKIEEFFIINNLLYNMFINILLILYEILLLKNVSL
jgi:hypothetical protein